jgi:hypothetical protein
MLHSLPAHSACGVHAMGVDAPTQPLVMVVCACGRPLLLFLLQLSGAPTCHWAVHSPAHGHAHEETVCCCTAEALHSGSVAWCLTLYPSKPLNSIDQTTKEATVQTQLVQHCLVGTPLVVYFLGLH